MPGDRSFDRAFRDENGECLPVAMDVERMRACTTDRHAGFGSDVAGDVVASVRPKWRCRAIPPRSKRLRSCPCRRAGVAVAPCADGQFERDA